MEGIERTVQSLGSGIIDSIIITYSLMRALPATQVCRGGFSRLGEGIADKITLYSGE